MLPVIVGRRSFYLALVGDLVDKPMTKHYIRAKSGVFRHAKRKEPMDMMQYRKPERQNILIFFLLVITVSAVCITVWALFFRTTEDVLMPNSAPLVEEYAQPIPGDTETGNDAKPGSGSVSLTYSKSGQYPSCWSKGPVAFCQSWLVKPGCGPLVGDSESGDSSVRQDYSGHSGGEAGTNTGDDGNADARRLRRRISDSFL